MDHFNVHDLLARVNNDGKLYHEFLRVPDISMGLYHLAAGSIDPQQPHSEDEVYYIVDGMGMITVGEEETAVMAGSIVYVPAHVKHHFHSISENLVIIVFFAPAEYSRRQSA